MFKPHLCLRFHPRTLEHKMQFLKSVVISVGLLAAYTSGSPAQSTASLLTLGPSCGDTCWGLGYSCLKPCTCMWDNIFAIGVRIMASMCLHLSHTNLLISRHANNWAWGIEYACPSQVYDDHYDSFTSAAVSSHVVLVWLAGICVCTYPSGIWVECMTFVYFHPTCMDWDGNLEITAEPVFLCAAVEGEGELAFGS
jgi:hypothetical protein